ncbi:CBS domain-containing protein [Halalkalicoccus ordinarius]|uniref:CBS domain-containing protein n=1 Tax=Halalkalicoccus ordinarius TaxID=3116651 RepID=UPI00300F30A6
MIELTVGDLPIDSAPSLALETPATEAARVLRDPNVSALVVLEDDETVVGIVTESDFVALVAEGSGDYSTDVVMSTPVVAIPSTASITAAAKRMRETGVKHLPVVDDGTYCGLVSATTLRPYLSPHRLEIDRQREPSRLESTDERRIPPGERRTRMETTLRP